jgi:PKD repeat protein
MRTLHILPVILLSAGLFNSCKKKELPEAEPGNDPQFYFRGDVNGSPVTLEAGVNDYYMHSSFNQNSNGCYSFQAHLKTYNCSSCPNSIRIDINDWKNTSMNGSSGADSAFIPTCYPYLTSIPGPITFTAQFFPLWSGAGNVIYYWDFGDGTSSTTFSPTHTFSRPGEYSVSLTAVDTNMCTSTIVNVQKFGITDNWCNTSIGVTTTSATTASFSHTSTTMSSASISSYLWNFGDGFFSSQSTPTHSYASHGMYPVSLKVVDTNNDTARANFNYSTPSNTLCAVNYIILNKGSVQNPGAWSNVVIKWYDSSGNEYSSVGTQPDWSYFRILSSQEYHNNESGQKTKKLHVRFSCKVYSATASMDITNADAVIVVAYK